MAKVVNAQIGFASQRTPIMTVDEVAKYLGIHRITVYRLLQTTDIPAMKLKGQWRFKKDILDAWLMRGMEESRRTQLRKAKPHATNHRRHHA